MEVWGGVEGDSIDIYIGKLEVALPYYWAYINAITSPFNSMTCDSKRATDPPSSPYLRSGSSHPPVGWQVVLYFIFLKTMKRKQK